MEGPARTIGIVEVILIPVLVFAEGAGGGETYLLIPAKSEGTAARETVFTIPAAAVQSGLAIAVSPTT